ncbi:hypothetical protein C8R47DRAFT_1325960 [Mycena vitilis]|nr:hypothetical protein C8R47DRAFT_1325960 [Mycena vitilis]
MISKLCVELLQEIGSQIPTADLESLRAVSRHFRAVIEPLFCASTTLVLKLKPGLDGGPSQLDILATGTTAWSYCRRLKIESLKAPKYRKLSLGNEPMHNLLRSALESLSRLHSVHWTLRSSDGDWARNIVIDILNSCDSFFKLTLVTEMSSRFPALPPVSGVRILTIDPTTATWKTLGDGFLPWVGKIIGSSPGLESLCMPGEGYTEISEVLQDKKIRLKNIYIPRPRISGSSEDLQPVLRYLASYSGLERLEMQTLPAEGTILFETVLPRHVQSLVVLSCPARIEGRSSFGIHNIPLISQLRNLETLEMSVNSHDMASEIVVRFLQTAVRLPALRNIALVAPARGAGFWRMFMNEYSQARINDAIALDGYQGRKDVLVPKVVLKVGTRYKMFSAFHKNGSPVFVPVDRRPQVGFKAVSSISLASM